MHCRKNLFRAHFNPFCRSPAACAAVPASFPDQPKVMSEHLKKITCTAVLTGIFPHFLAFS